VRRHNYNRSVFLESRVPQLRQVVDFFAGLVPLFDLEPHSPSASDERRWLEAINTCSR
jgi:hypothetical protein